MSKKNLIDSIEVKSPCSEDWNKMKGSDKVRFCGHCAFEVNNISALTRKQAMRLVRESGGKICVRYIKNPVNNTPVFADKLYQINRRAGIAAGVLGASLALSTIAYAQGKPVLINKNTDAQNEQMEKAQTFRENNTFKGAAISFSGEITDSNGAIIPDIVVVLIGENIGFKAATITNEEGFYKFINVVSGNYTLKIESQKGFAAKEMKEIAVGVSNDLKQDISLDVNLDVNLNIVVSGGAMFVEYLNPLHTAISNDDIDEVKNLITRGENVNGKDENYSNITPLFLAVENGNAETVETLLNFGAKINARDNNKQTPLMRLDEDASIELVNLLIKHGAKINLVDNAGNNALIFTSRSVKREVLQILLEEGANLNAQNRAGRTALMEAADADNLENVRALLEAGAEVNLKDKSGETAFDLTTDEEIESLLENFGAVVKEN